MYLLGGAATVMIMAEELQEMMNENKEIHAFSV